LMRSVQRWRYGSCECRCGRCASRMSSRFGKGGSCLLECGILYVRDYLFLD
jgi:hypothetical protein